MNSEMYSFFLFVCLFFEILFEATCELEKTLLICICVLVIFTHLSSQAAEIISQTCYPTCQDCSTSADLFHIAGGDDGGTVAAVVDCPFMGIPPSLSQTLGVRVVACGNESEFGVEIGIMSQILTLPPKATFLSTLVSIFSFFFFPNSTKNPNYHLTGFNSA